MPTITVAPYTASIDRLLLKNLFFMGEFDTVAEGIELAGSLTSEQINTCVLSIVKKTGKAIYDPDIIEQSLNGF